MDEDYLQEHYQACINPWEDVPEEFMSKRDAEKDDLSRAWDHGEPFNYDWPIRDWIKFQMEHDLIKASVLDWEIFKQVIDDLLADDHLRAFEGAIKFCVIPKVKKYPTIQQYNFSYELHLKDYVDKVFEWLRYVDGHLFRIIELGEFKNGEFQFILKDHQKERLQTLKNIIKDVEEDHERHEKLDIAYELNYRHGNITIKGASTTLHKTDSGSAANFLFKALFAADNRQVHRNDIEEPITRPFREILTDMKFKGPYGKLFVPEKGADSAILNKTVTNKELREAGLEKLNPEELTQKMKLG